MNETRIKVEIMDPEESAEIKQEVASDEENYKMYEQVLKNIEEMSVHLKPLFDADGSDEESITNSAEDLSSPQNVDTSKEICDANKLVKSEKKFNPPDQTKIGRTIGSEDMSKIKTNLISSPGESENHKSVQGADKRNVKNSPAGFKNGAITSHPNLHLIQPQHNKCVLSRPMQRKLLSLLQCRLVEEEGQARAARIARSLGERVVTELLVLQQYPHQLSSNLWAAVRTRGCQFLGPAMQEEVLKLILLALEDGSPLSRKVLVLFVVQKLEVRYSQASKTAIGHVVQLLYRASCFKVQKRDGESSLMQLKEEFRQYEALRREHDSQIVQIALEAGLRISPDQWSSLLYGDVAHKPHMQSIIDKHQSPQSFAQNIVELMGMLPKNPNGGNLLRLRPHLEFLSNVDPSSEAPALSWESLGAVMRSVNTTIKSFVEYLTVTGGEYGLGVATGQNATQDTSLAQNTRYKTSMCRDYSSRGSCPRGPTCTFAHTQEEMEKFRLRSRKNGVRGRLPTHEKTTSSLTQSESDQLRQVQMLTKVKNDMPSQTATMSSQIPLPREDRVNEAAKMLATLSTSSVLRNNDLSEIKLVPNNEILPGGNDSLKFTPGNVDKGQQANMPMTLLTFSRPALDGQEPSNASALNQQASLHPNNPHARPFFPAQNFPMSSSSPPHIPQREEPVVVMNRSQPPDSGGIVKNSAQQQQQHQHLQQQQQQEFRPGTALPPVAGPANFNPFIRPSDARLSYSGDYNPYQSIRLPQDGQLNPVVMDQFVQRQQLQVGVVPTAQVKPYPIQQAKDASSLGDLWQRKQDIIKHLQNDPTFLGWEDKTFYQADSQRAGFHGLNTVLNLNKHTHDLMPKPVSDSFVAARSTQSLDKLVFEESAPSMQQLISSREKAELEGMAGFTLHHPSVMHQAGNQQAPSLIASSASANVYHSSGANVYNSSCAEAWPRMPLSLHNVCEDVNVSGVESSNINHEYMGKDMINNDGIISNNAHLLLSTSATATNGHSLQMSSAQFSSYAPSSSQTYQGQQMTLYNSLNNGSNVTSMSSSEADSEFSQFPHDGDENFIPSEETKVSKFGPISRLNKTKNDYNAPMQVTSDLTRPVFSTASTMGFGLEHGSINSQAASYMNTSPSLAPARLVERLHGEPAVKPTALENRSIWEQSPLPSYKNIAQLMVGAAGAVSNNEKLAYQLQAVELEISMKTGRKPDPVSKIIQAAVGSSSLMTPSYIEHNNMMGVVGPGRVTACLTNLELGSNAMADERFPDWNGVSK